MESVFLIEFRALLWPSSIIHDLAAKINLNLGLKDRLDCTSWFSSWTLNLNNSLLQFISWECQTLWPLLDNHENQSIHLGFFSMLCSAFKIKYSIIFRGARVLASLSGRALSSPFALTTWQMSSCFSLLQVIFFIFSISSPSFSCFSPSVWSVSDFSTDYSF